MLRRCSCLVPAGRSAIARGFFRGPPVPFAPRSVFDELQRQFENEFKHLQRWSQPFASEWRPFAEHPTDSELYRLRHPIVEENGVKKFKIELDVRRFKPEDVKISTNKEEGTLQVDARHKDEHSSFEYSRKVKVPEGVQLQDISAKFTTDHTLLFEAPYSEPAAKEPPKEHVLEIKHN